MKRTLFIAALVLTGAFAFARITSQQTLSQGGIHGPDTVAILTPTNGVTLFAVGDTGVVTQAVTGAARTGFWNMVTFTANVAGETLFVNYAGVSIDTLTDTTTTTSRFWWGATDTITFTMSDSAACSIDTIRVYPCLRRMDWINFHIDSYVTVYRSGPGNHSSQVLVEKLRDAYMWGPFDAVKLDSGSATLYKGMPE